MVINLNMCSNSTFKVLRKHMRNFKIKNVRSNRLLNSVSGSRSDMRTVARSLNSKGNLGRYQVVKVDSLNRVIGRG